MNYICLQANITLIPIYSNDKELFRKCREICNKINELLDIDDPTDFVRTTLCDDEFFVLDVHKNTSTVRNKYRNNLVFVFHSFLNEFPQTSLV